MLKGQYCPSLSSSPSLPTPTAVEKEKKMSTPRCTRLRRAPSASRRSPAIVGLARRAPAWSNISDSAMAKPVAVTDEIATRDGSPPKGHLLWPVYAGQWCGVRGHAGRRLRGRGAADCVRHAGDNEAPAGPKPGRASLRDLPTATSPTSWASASTTAAPAPAPQPSCCLCTSTSPAAPSRTICAW